MDDAVAVEVAVGVGLAVAETVAVELGVGVGEAVGVAVLGAEPRRAIRGPTQTARSWLKDPFVVTFRMNLTLLPAKALRSRSIG